ncbi:allantoate amidohydrolase [Anaerobacillus arseniciselenatis]|uniref:Allantoate amidohydrolase n=1 Tax=Anaerobacillus arseniciselenatis TaxID=85682 RepID=A0A1S2LT98_9BACI|nr:Zn-dependent hydrolase [Anaerobacillus arseniciselenatis]OIJ15586.1 allantoate amidohydrolase [Anaerobacillus arseniciselenatis]
MSLTKDFSKQLYDRLMTDYDNSLSESGINGERLAMRLAMLSEVGLTAEGGSSRMGFSKEERAAKELVKTWMKEAGLDVREDGAGNIFGRLQGQEKDSQVVMSGSHVDTVPNGGHFDGTLGVLTALEVVEAWRETGYQPNKTFEVAIFTDEEGSRFNGGFSGSAAMLGDVERDEQVALKDVYGQSFQQVLEDDGLTVDGYFSSTRNKEEIAAFVEVHIEQGKQLEKKDLPVGVVTGIAGPSWLEVTFLGEAGHAGNTPMNDRSDALIAASQFIAQIESLPRETSPTAVATIGKMQVHPNGINVIPGKVTLTVDIRDIHEETRDLLIDKIVELGKRIAEERSVGINFHENIRIKPVPISFKMQGKVMKAVEEEALSAHLLPSGAGHDSMIIGRHIPVAMLFARSKDGISHNPKEWTALNDCVVAAKVLKNLIEDLTR